MPDFKKNLLLNLSTGFKDEIEYQPQKDNSVPSKVSPDEKKNYSQCKVRCD